jgi:predicted Zn-dependent protease
LVLRERQRHDEALVEFRAAVRRDPAFGPAWLMAGSVLLGLDRPREAIADLQRATTLMPDQVVAWRALAEAYQRTGDLAGVVAVWRRLAAAEPIDPEVVYRLGRAYLAQSQWAHDRLRRVHPASARVSQALGREYLQQGRPDLALAAYQEAARRAPALSGLHLSMAGILLDQGQLDAAAREVDAELVATPGSAEALALKAKIAAARPR